MYKDISIYIAYELYMYRMYMYVVTGFPLKECKYTMMNIIKNQDTSIKSGQVHVHVHVHVHVCCSSKVSHKAC